MNRIVARRDGSLVARITSSFELRSPGGAFVRAGSALLRIGTRLLAVQDDAQAVAWIDPATRGWEPQVLEGAGTALAKADKPDFEAAFVMEGEAWILGSGSRPNRRRIARLDPGTGAVSLIDARELYEAVEAALGMAPNIEGAVPQGALLRLFHRGSRQRRDSSARVDVPLAALRGGAAPACTVTTCDLGEIGGLPLGFTDAVALDERRVLYLAAAEDTPDGIADGPVAGAAVGILEDAEARWTPLLEEDGSPSRRKVEGVALDPDRNAGWLITDPDDAARPAELCRLDLSR